MHSCGAKLKPARNKTPTFAEDNLTSSKHLSSCSERGWILFLFTGWFRRCTEFSSLVLCLFPTGNLLLFTRSLSLSHLLILIQAISLERSKKIIQELAIFNGLKINSISHKCFNLAGKLALHDLLIQRDNLPLQEASRYPIRNYMPHCNMDNSVWWDFL